VVKESGTGKGFRDEDPAKKQKELRTIALKHALPIDTGRYISDLVRYRSVSFSWSAGILPIRIDQEEPSCPGPSNVKLPVT
jgi:hypothetical protein